MNTDFQMSAASYMLSHETNEVLSLSSRILADPMVQLSDEFDLHDIHDVQTKLLFNANSLQSEHNRKAVFNYFRECARALLLKLQNLRSLGAASQQIRQVGIDTLKALEYASYKMIEDYAGFQAGSKDLNDRFSQFDAKAANPITWSALSEQVPEQNVSTPSPLLGAIGKYMKTKREQTSVLENVLEQVNSYQLQNKEKNMSTSPLSNPQNQHLPTQLYPQAQKLGQPSIILSNGTPEAQEPSGFDLSPGMFPPDHRDLYLLMNNMAGKIHQFSASAFTGEKFKIEGAKSFTELQSALKTSEAGKAEFLLRKSNTHEHLSELKQAVKETTLPEIVHFTERKNSDARQEYPKQAVKCIGSKAILNFNDKDKRPKLLFVASELDHNGAVSPLYPPNCKILKELNTHYDVKYMTAGKIQEVYDQMRKCPENYLSGLVIDAHGEPYKILFETSWDGTFTDKEAMSRLKDKSFVHLFSCSTGMVEEQSPVYKLRDSLNALGKKILISAPITPVGASDIEIRSHAPLKVRYKIDYFQCSLMEACGIYPLKCRKLPNISSENETLDATRLLSTSEQGINYVNITIIKPSESASSNSTLPTGAEIGAAVNYLVEWYS
jgi:hypothetical protein